MASFTVSSSHPFPVGTVVSVYNNVGQLPERAPRGTAVTSATVQAGGGLSFSGLAEGAHYFAAGLVGSEWRWLSFMVEVVPTDMATQAELDAAVALKQDASTAATDAELAVERARVQAVESGGWGKDVQGTQGGTVAAPASTRIWSFQPTDAAKAPFRWVIGGASFNGTWDTVMYLGYNVADGGGRAVSAEPQFGFMIEQDYKSSPTANPWVEAYFMWGHSALTGLTPTRRPIFMRFDRTTGDMVGFDLVTKGISFLDWGNEAQIATIEDRTGSFRIMGHASQTLDSVLSVTAQNAKQASFQLSGGNGTFAVNSLAAQQWAIAIQGTNVLRLGPTKAAVGGELEIGTLNVQTQAAQKDNNPTLFLKRVAAQSTRLMEWKDESNNRLGAIHTDGAISTFASAVPTDGAVDTGEMVLWFDKTAGAAKLMVKARNAAGTVVTGSVALA